MYSNTMYPQQPQGSKANRQPQAPAQGSKGSQAQPPQVAQQPGLVANPQPTLGANRSPQPQAQGSKAGNQQRHGMFGGMQKRPMPYQWR